MKAGIFYYSSTGNTHLACQYLAQRIKTVAFEDESRCTECGTCADGCPYDAIDLNPKPVFNTSRCHGCWICFNHCPEQAIYISKIRGQGHYPQPLPQFAAKMEV